MERTTNDIVRNVFGQLCRRLNEFGVDTSRYQLDRMTGSDYPGWVVTERSIENGGVHCPFGHSRRKNAEMVDAMKFTLDVLYQVRAAKGE